MKKNLLALAVSLIVSLVLLEVGIRLFAGSRIPVKDHRDDMFWVASREFGWTKKPNSSGHFSNGLYNGYIVNDQFGNRKNSDAGTYVEGYRNIFFIGDSTAVALEVNNHETVPALLESALRRQGLQVNVLNFGVRGYGTDQSVRKALHFASRFKPWQIIYMYCDNDFIDNNTIKRSYKKFGKGVYIRPRGERDFKVHNYPVPVYKPNYASIVVLDPNGHPFIHEAVLPEKDLEFREKHDRFKVALKKHFYLLRAYSYLKDVFKHHLKDGVRASAIHDIDPYAIIQSGQVWSESFSAAYIDGSKVRVKYKKYFNDQMKYLLSQLGSIENLEKTHLVWFPSANELQLFKEGKSANHELFTELINAKIVSSYVNLNARLIDTKVDIRDLRSQADHHFSKRGNEWIAEQLVKQIRF